MSDETPTIGYLRYRGRAVEDGVIDAKSAGEALISFNDTLSHTISIQYPFLSDLEISTPVVIRKGSWEALIPNTIETWLGTAAGVAFTTYLTTAVKKLAENGFKDKKLGDVFRDGLEGVLWLIRLAKHLETSAKRKLENLSWRKNNEEVGIKNDDGDIMWVPVWVIKVYELTSESLLVGMIRAIEDERTLTIGVRVEDRIEEVAVEENEKKFFIAEKEDDDVLFPELTHGARVILEGYVTRGTETSNSIGFRYQNHILTCYPSSGNIKRFKKNLFMRCNIFGAVSRADKLGGTNDPRPKIVFDDLIDIENTSAELPLENKEGEQGNA